VKDVEGCVYFESVEKVILQRKMVGYLPFLQGSCFSTASFIFILDSKKNNI
jgi:hypothetical protein